MDRPAPRRASDYSPASPRLWHFAAVAVLQACVLAAAPPPANAQGEGPGQPRWRVLDVDCGATLIRQQRSAPTHDQPAADDLRIRAGYGTQALASLAIPRARVISELSVSVPVRSDRVGLQALVRVVLPRTTNPKTGGPITVRVPGTSLRTNTQWETLVVNQIPQQLERQVRVLQLSCENSIDVREAYVDAVLVNVYGGAGVTNVALGDPIIVGAAAIPTHGLDSAAIHNVAYRSEKHRKSIAPRLEGDILYVRGRPLFVSMIDDHGEPWTLLKAMGINTVRLNAPVTFDQLAKARKLGMWIVSPPPQTKMTDSLAQHFDRIIAWDLGSGLTDKDFAATRDSAQLLREARRQRPLPIVCEPTCDLAHFGRCADIVIHRRLVPMALRFKGDRYDCWLQRRMDTAPPTTVHWAAIETQPASATLAQANALGLPQPPYLDSEEIHEPTVAAVTAGVRGVYFRSRSRIDSPRVEDEYRRLAIQRTNLDVQLIEPWLAAGRRIPDNLAAPTGYAMRGVQTDRSTLFLLSRERSGTTALDAQNPIVLPDVSDTTGVYCIGPTGVIPISHRRVAGGAELTSLVAATGDRPRLVLLLVTSDDLIVRAVAERINRSSSQIAEVVSEQIKAALAAASPSSGEAHRLRTALQTYQAAVASGDAAAAHALGGQVLGEQQASRQRSWLAAWQPLCSPTACALATHPCTRAALTRFLRALPQNGRALNVLAGGACDRADDLLTAGWRNAVDARRANAEVAITAHQPQAGSGCLQITATWADGLARPLSDDRAIAWSRTAAVAIGAGQIVRIDGWIKIEDAFADGELVIYDSIAGPALGIRFTETADGDWQPFTIYRAAAQSAELELSFALTGPGTAYIDEVSMTPVLPTGNWARSTTLQQTSVTHHGYRRHQ